MILIEYTFEGDSLCVTHVFRRTTCTVYLVCKFTTSQQYQHNVYNELWDMNIHYVEAMNESAFLSIIMNNYIVRSYRDVIVITKFATRRANKAKSIAMY